MKMKNILFPLLFLTQSLFAQYTVQGVIKDSNGAAIEFANVVLYQSSDNALIKGVVSDANGGFKIENIKENKYYIKVMMLGYSDFKSDPFELNAQQADFEMNATIEEDATTLDQVEVVAKVPLLEQRADRMVVNVAKSLTGVNGSLMDIVRKVPGMLVVNGKLSLAGNSNPTILINGRSTKYMDIQSLLKEMPGNNIERIEVIHQPGAEFEASGTGPLINIILKKSKLFGTNGSVRAGIGKSSRWRYNSGVSLNSRQGAVNLFGGGGYSYNAYQEQLGVDRIQDNDRYISTNIQPDLPKTYYANAGMDWYINDKHTIGFSGRMVGSTNNRTNINNTTIKYIDDRANTELETRNQLNKKWKYYRTNLNYTYEIDTTGQKIDFDANYAYFDRTSNNNTTTILQSGVSDNFPDQRNQQPGLTKIYALKLDYTKPINDAISLQFGGKYSNARLDNDLTSDIFINNEWIINKDQTNEFDFQEDIAAIYGKATFSKNGWDGTLGLRYEDSYSKGYSVTLDSTQIRDIKQLFPSASISRKITKELALAFAYSYRIERPRYSSLNPFIVYMDPFTYEEGNPILRPEFTHSTKLSLSYEGQPFFNLEYAKTKDIITLITQQNPVTKATSAFDGNLDSYEKIGGSLFFPLSFVPGLDGYGGFMLYNNKYKDSEQEDYNSSRWTFTSFIQAEFTLPGKIRTEINGWYTNGGQDGIIVYEHMFGVGFGLERKFLNDQLSISLSVDEVLNRFFYGDLDFGNTQADIKSSWDRRIVSLSASYRFGNNFSTKRKRGKNSASDEINRAQEK